MLPVNRLHNTAAPALHITIPSNTSKNGTISRPPKSTAAEGALSAFRRSISYQLLKNDPATAPAVQFYCKVSAEPAAASANGMAIAPPATPKLLRGMAFMSTSPFTERRSAST